MCKIFRLAKWIQYTKDWPNDWSWWSISRGPNYSEVNTSLWKKRGHFVSSLQNHWHLYHSEGRDSSALVTFALAGRSTACPRVALCESPRPKTWFFPRQNLTQTNSHDPTASHLCPEKTPCTPPTSSCPPPASSCPVPTSCNLPRCSCHKFAPHCIAVLLLPVHRNKIGAKVTLQICLETI